ncbi:MAG TPA: cation:proton antiporter [Euzebyales bacterium]
MLAAALGARLQVPGALLFLALGMLIGDDGLDWVSPSDPVVVQSLGVLALVVILFEGGLTTDLPQLRRGAAPGLALATVGVALTAGVTALGAVWLLGLPSRVAWLVGAIVASTDAAAVFELLRRAPCPSGCPRCSRSSRVRTIPLPCCSPSACCRPGAFPPARPRGSPSVRCS